MREYLHVRPVLFSILVCLMALFVVACGGPSSAVQNKLVPAPPKEQVLRLPIGAPDFGSLDPALAVNTQDNLAVGIIFSGLVQLKNDGTVTTDLAASYEVSPDGLSYTFTLKPNLTFSDGTPLTATDIAYSINRALLPATQSPTSSDLAPIKDFAAITSGKIKSLIGDSLLVPNDHTITIVLGAPAAYFLETLTSVNAFAVNKKLIDKYGTRWTDHLEEGAGSGAFKVASYSHSQGLVLVPNTHYAGHKAILQKIELLPSGDPATTYREYLAGQFDFASVPLDDLASAKHRKDYYQDSALSIIYLTMNYLAKPFDNIKIRQAFALALNKDVLAKNVLHDAYMPTNHLLPQGMPGYNMALKGPAGVSSTAGDTNKARELLQEGLQEAGYSSASALPPITFTAPEAGQDFKNLTEAIVQQWQTVLGINVQLNTVSNDVFGQQDANTIGHAGPLQIWLSGYAYLPDPFFWLSTFFSAGSSSNDSNYGQNNSSAAPEQQAVQQELSKADADLNPQRRIAEYNDAEQKIVDDVAWIPLVQGETYALVNPKLQNFTTKGQVIPWSNIYFTQ